MSRWEPEDDDGVYGFPDIAQLKRDPNVVPWERWDAVMSEPKTGTDYAFSGSPEQLWQGSARAIFSALKREHIRPVLALRNTDPGRSPSWAAALNPPQTERDWNEWWEHVFATTYWLNVRNDYRVDDFEIHNEPDNPDQGWAGTQADYFELVRVAADAIAHVYATYLPDRTYHIHAPKTIGWSRWPRDALATIPTYIDSINVHNYDWDTASYVRQVRQWMNNSPHARSPLWLGEWGTYTTGYDNLAFSLNLLENMIRMSQPGDTYVYGSHLFSLYDWGENADFEGLIDARGDRRLSYYAFRMGIRALQGGRDVLLMSNPHHPDLTIMATRKGDSLFLLVVNTGSAEHVVNADLPALGTQRKKTIWEFSETILDAVIEEVEADDIPPGPLSLSVPAHASRLMQLQFQSLLAD